MKERGTIKLSIVLSIPIYHFARSANISGISLKYRSVL